jgi:hypothetical protein
MLQYCGIYDSFYIYKFITKTNLILKNSIVVLKKITSIITLSQRNSLWRSIVTGNIIKNLNYTGLL